MTEPQRSRYWIIKLLGSSNTPVLSDLPFQEAQYRQAYYSSEDKTVRLLVKFKSSQRSSYFKSNINIISTVPSDLRTISSYDNYLDTCIGTEGSLKDNGSTINNDSSQDQSSCGQQHNDHCVSLDTDTQDEKLSGEDVSSGYDTDEYIADFKRDRGIKRTIQALNAEHALLAKRMKQFDSIALE